MIKRITALLLAGVITVILLTACGAGNANLSANDTAEEKLSVVTTIFPQYDWVRQILGEQQADLTLLLDNGVDLHSYQPTVDDIVKISTCDMFIYVGGESDEWVDDALANINHTDMIVINLFEVLGDALKEEEIVEGMGQEDDEDHDDGDAELDEHVWLSLRNAQTLCTYISEQLGALNPAYADEYEANAAAYNALLSELDGKYVDAVSNGRYDTLLFCDRFPFRYLADDYDLNYYAAFSGCSAETEASFETVAFLADKADELGLDCVIVIETSDQAIARTVIENSADTSRQILVLDSIQSVTSSDAVLGASYLSIMQDNLETLIQALG